MKRKARYEILESAQFSGALDCWTEWLCLQRDKNGKITLSSRSHEYLDEASNYKDEEGNEHLAKKMHAKKVSHIGCDVVVREDLVLHDDYAEITLEKGELNNAKSWLEERGGQETRVHRGGRRSGLF